METKLPTTEQELNDLIDARVKEATESLVAQHNGQMATMRKKYDDDLKKAKEQANMTAEEIAAQKIKEQQDADQQELTELRAYKRSSIISGKLAKEGLPDFLKNDSRLLNASEGDLDKVIKDVKKDYEANLPKGATHSTVVTNPSGNPQGGNGNSEKQVAYDKMGNILKDVVS